jgi:hypothetical protein
MADVVGFSVETQRKAQSSATYRSHQDLILILILILMMFVADGLNSVLLNTGYNFYRVSIFVRFIAQVYFLLLLLRTNKFLRFISIFLLLFYIFLLGTLAGIGNLYTLSDSHLVESFIQFDKMLFYFIAWETLRFYFPKGDQRKRLFKLFEILILAQSLTIIVGFVFNLQLFAAYLRPDSGETVRFGFQGLIPAQNEVSAFFILAFFYFLIKVSYKKKGFFGLFLTTVSGVLTGTKVTLILPIILGFYILGWLLKYIRMTRKYLPIAITVLTLGITTFVARGYLLSRLAPTLAYYSYTLQNEQRSWISIIMSGRDLKVQTLFSEYLSKFNLFNYLFGGQDLTSYSTEMDMIDVFARLGLIGAFIFYFYYLRLLLLPSREIGLNRILFVLVWLGVSAFSGHIIFSAINGTYLPILLLAFLTFESQKYNDHQRQTLHGRNEPEPAAG